MSLSVPAASDSPMPVLRYFDVVLIVVAAPIMLLIGVPALGYGLGAGTWIGLRAVGLGVERAGLSVAPNQMIGIRMVYMLGRLFLLALAVILARQSGSRADGLTALVVIVFAFTLQLGTSAVPRPSRSATTRPRSR